jgi:hypothetical protein
LGAEVAAGGARGVRERAPAAGRVLRPHGVDKSSHSAGHEAPVVGDALGIADAVLAELRADAERGGWWRDTTVFVVSDHGHSPVRAHDDLADWFRSRGHRTVAHPFTWRPGREVAVMVSGNAMAHVYLELARRERPWWEALAARWEPAVGDLLARPSVDLVLLPLGDDACEVRHASRGAAAVRRGRRPGAGPATRRASRTRSPTSRATAATRSDSGERWAWWTPTPRTTRAPGPTTPTPWSR